MRKKFIIHARQHRLILGSKTKIMGILNVTTDSFSNDGCLRHEASLDQIVKQAEQIIKDGAHILDVGGESTRPGAKPVYPKEEIKRIVPVIKKLIKISKIPISVDTYKPDVAKAALDAGASMVNDVMGSKPDKELLKLVKRNHAAIVLMHILGTPRTMQTKIHYDNLIADIINELQKSVEKCLEIGIKSDRIIIDPGIGFGKTVQHNLEIIRRLEELNILNCPVLIGTSRKSFIGKVLNREVCDRLMGTAATVSIAIRNGAHIVRVHDVKEIRDVVRMTDVLLN